MRKRRSCVLFTRKQLCRYGKEAEKLVETARSNIAKLIGATANEIVFTSGATESNNLAIKGVAKFAAKGEAKKNHVITTVTVRAQASSSGECSLSRVCVCV
jgi:cysteine sulfinate desulfinase/cysteine desulfurase-like protein